MELALSIDTESDLHTGLYEGIVEGIPNFLEKIRGINIKITFFVTAEVLEKFPDYFRGLDYEGHEIALHGLEHERFDDLSYDEKERRVVEAIRIYENTLYKKPKGFRAPQHSVDEDLLKILNKHNFLYDSSHTPLNFFQLLFFPKRWKSWAKNVFVNRKKHKISKNFFEIPTTSIILPFVSLIVRIFPTLALNIYFNFLRIFNKEIIFYAHSWDFIKLQDSKIDKLFSHNLFVSRFSEFIIKKSNNKSIKFVKMKELLCKN